jgi:hypothetical protein
MTLYLDDDSASVLLGRFLVKAGHDVQHPLDAGIAGEDDSVHLAYAARQKRVLLSHNYHDFENLHDLVLAVSGCHPGILVIRKDNDPRRDLTERGIVRAIGNLVSAGVGIANQYIVLNQWR